MFTHFFFSKALFTLLVYHSVSWCIRTCVHVIASQESTQSYSTCKYYSICHCTVQYVTVSCIDTVIACTMVPIGLLVHDYNMYHPVICAPSPEVASHASSGWLDTACNLLYILICCGLSRRRRRLREKQRRELKRRRRRKQPRLLGLTEDGTLIWTLMSSEFLCVRCTVLLSWMWQWRAGGM